VIGATLALTASPVSEARPTPAEGKVIGSTFTLTSSLVSDAPPTPAEGTYKDEQPCKYNPLTKDKTNPPSIPCGTEERFLSNLLVSFDTT
jgi:hypothetical protein